MADEKLCKLCQTNRALELDHEKASDKSANNLLLRLFDCYNIDVSVLGESPSTCKPCYEGVQQISEQLQKWSNAQEVLRQTACRPDVDDHTVISAKEEAEALWDENDDANFLSEDSLELEKTSNSNDFEFLDREEQIKDFEVLEEEEAQTEDVELLNKEEPQTEDVESFVDGVSAKVYEELFGIKQIIKKSTRPLDWRLTPREFFCVCLGPDGLALAVVFKDKTQQSNVRFLCTCCNQVFATVFDIRQHSLVSRAHPEYWCRLCGIQFPNIRDLKLHEEQKNHQVAPSNFVIRCLKCGKVSTHFFKAIRHQNTVHGKVSFKCKMCNMTFQSCISLGKHPCRHKNYILCCYPSCQQKFKLWEQYVSHLNWHKSLVSRCPVPCCTRILVPGEHDMHLRTHSKDPSQILRWKSTLVRPKVP